MRILDRYLLREFLVYLLLGLLGFIVIFIVVDLIEKMDVFLDHKAPWPLVLQYFVNLAPDVIVKMLPVSLLLATFLALGQLNKFGELTAMRAGGLSLVRILMPVYGVAVACVLGSLALGEYVVPAATRARDEIFEERIQHIQRSTPSERADVTYLGRGGRIWVVGLYLVHPKRMHDVSLQEFEKGQLVRRIDAREANWDGKRWVFSSGFVRKFTGTGKESAEAFGSMAVNGLGEVPDDFAKEGHKPEEMNWFELRNYVERLRSSGARVENYLVDLHLKLAFPLICLIVVIIGGALSTRLRMQGAALGFGLSIAISFLYYGIMRASQALGHNGALSPYVAAWFADVLFGAIAIVMMAEAQKR
ncbi:MAG: LptF/LptG family permease [Candidatus Eisenbacteria bacterium]|nr:LptF/LptG family permease [Candidatus Eisenbacteria bacterium]